MPSPDEDESPHPAASEATIVVTSNNETTFFFIFLPPYWLLVPRYRELDPLPRRSDGLNFNVDTGR